jgi:hypothetical protein
MWIRNFESPAGYDGLEYRVYGTPDEVFLAYCCGGSLYDASVKSLKASGALDDAGFCYISGGGEEKEGCGSDVLVATM